MTPGRLIREGIERPGPMTYFAIAASTALIVFAVAGYASQLDADAIYLPAHMASSASASSTGLTQAASGRAVASSAGQTVYIDASEGVFKPNQVSVRAGVPVRLVFTRGRSCTSLVRFDSLDVTADLSRDGVVVRLPALRAGVYSFRCAHGSTSGLLLAE